MPQFISEKNSITANLATFLPCKCCLCNRLAITCKLSCIGWSWKPVNSERNIFIHTRRWGWAEEWYSFKFRRSEHTTTGWTWSYQATFSAWSVTATVLWKFIQKRAKTGCILTYARRRDSPRTTSYGWVIEWIFEGQPPPPQPSGHKYLPECLTLYITDTFVLSTFP